MRMAILAPRYGLVWRGVETFTKELAGRLGGEFEVDILSRQNTWCMAKFGQEMEMLTFAVGAIPKLFGYDVVFVQSGVWGAVAARVVRYIRGTPYIYRSAGGREPWIVRQMPDVYAATTEVIAGWIKEFAPRQRVVVIPNGVDLTKFKFTNSQIHKRKSLRVLCVGALEKHKRIALAIEAVARVESARLTVIGDGPLFEEIRKLGLQRIGPERFDLIRKVPFAEMPRYYNAADVFTLPSWEEPFGTVYVEAMAMGLPVVAPDDPSRREILGPNGVYCNVEEVGQYAQAIQEARDKKIIMKWVKRFDWKQVAGKYQSLLRELGNAGGGSNPR